MLKHTIAVAAFAACCASAFPDYIADREAAVKLVEARKHEEALAAFVKMAAADVTDFQKSDALEQAAACAQRLKRYDQAMGLAQQIPLAAMSKTCQMRIMMGKRKRKELIDRFGDEDIGAWPDIVIGDASYLRGRAHYFLKHGKRAEEDLKRAGDYLMEDNAKGLALNALGDTYQHLLKDDARAVAAYRRTYKTRNIYKRCHAAMAVARILSRQNKHAEALQELERLGPDRVTIPYWRGLLLCAYGDVLAAAGSNAEAIAKYREALQLEGVSPGTKKACEKALKHIDGVGD